WHLPRTRAPLPVGGRRSRCRAGRSAAVWTLVAPVFLPSLLSDLSVSAAGRSNPSLGRGHMVLRALDEAEPLAELLHQVDPEALPQVIEKEHGRDKDGDVHAGAAGGGPVDVLELQEQSELVEDEGQPDAERDGEDRVPPSCLKGQAEEAGDDQQEEPPDVG